MNAALETVACPMCGGDGFDHVVTRADGLNIVRCQRCRLAYLNPRPTVERLQEMYTQEYYVGASDKPIGYVSYRPSKTDIRWYPPMGWELVCEEVHLEGLRTLDIGCAFGQMVYWMAKAGANATGIDIAREPVEWGREALALDLRQTSLERLQEPEGSFDVVTMMDLIEHVVDLRGFMGRLASLLKPGGLVFVKTPNFGAYQFWGNRLAVLRFSLEHILCFEVATLDALFARFGMLPKSATCVLFGVSADVDVWLRQRKRGRGPVRRLVRRLPGIDVVRWLRARLLSRKRMYRFDESGVQGSQIVGCYQKPCRGAQGSAKQGPPGPAVSNGVPGR